MSTALLNFLLYVPFLFIALPLALIYLRAGYRKGLWRALISLGVTVLTAALSILLSNFLSDLFSEPLVAMIPAEAFEEIGVLKDFVLSVVSGLVKVVLSFVLFGLLFFLFLTILKAVSNRFGKAALDAKEESPKWFRWSGLAVRLLDTLVVTTVLLIPLYGFLSTAVAPAASMVSLMGSEEREIKEYLDCVKDHPMIVLYQKGPATLVMRGLADFSVGTANINLAEMAETVAELSNQFDRLKNASDADRLEAVQEFTNFAKDNLVQQEWCYEMVSLAREELTLYLDGTETDETTKETVNEILSLLGDSQEVFQENAETLLDFVSYGLENDLPEFLESGNVEDLSSETLDRFGDMMNASEQFLSAKRLLVFNFTEAVFLQSYSQNSPSQEAEQQAKEDSREFVRNYFGSGEVSEEQREAEGRCLISALSGNVSSVEEFFQSHPLFGEEAVAELYQKGILTE